MKFSQRVREPHPNLYIYLALLLAIFAIYAQVVGFDFINFDDDLYITHNHQVLNGISAQGLKWALTSGDKANWFPVTRISEMLDGQLFGLRSGWHHLENVAWHALATVLLFAFLYRATSARWRSAFVAFLFALHPLHVESVAWVAERKDVLGAFFWFLTLWAYVRYAERPLAGRYRLVLLCFCLGLMSKPMVVTLPIVLVLLDVWPLRRWSPKTPRLKEKIPFFILSAAMAVVTYLVQRSGSAVVSFGTTPLGLRVANALTSYIVYIGKMLWPVDLGVYYPYPKELPAWQPILAAIAIAGVSVLALRSLRRHPYFAVGWFWYVVTLVPVIGLVQVGGQARADRYMYLPMVGLLIVLAWAPRDIRIPLADEAPPEPASGRSRGRERAVLAAWAAAAAVACLAAAAVTWVQIGYWRNSESLFRHTAEVTQDNSLAHEQLGLALAETPGRIPEAIAEYELALSFSPDFVQVYNDMGLALAETPGRLPDAIASYRAALRIRPGYAKALNNLGVALSKIPGRLPEAMGMFEAALRLSPNGAQEHGNLGNAFMINGQLPEAVSEYKTALRLEPWNAALYNNLGLALSHMPGHLEEAVLHYRKAASLKAGYASPHTNLGNLLAEAPGRLPDAIAEYQASLRIQPDNADVHKYLANALTKNGRFPEAIAEYQAALRLSPDLADAHNNLGMALMNVEGRLPDAIAEFEAALRIQPGYADAHRNLDEARLKLSGRVK